MIGESFMTGNYARCVNRDMDLAVKGTVAGRTTVACKINR